MLHSSVRWRRLATLAIVAAAVSLSAVLAERAGGGPDTLPVEGLSAQSTPGGVADGVGGGAPRGVVEVANPTAVAARDGMVDTPVEEFELVVGAPYDAIPAIDDPQFISATDADEMLLPRDLVLGVSVGDDHRAYGVAFLSGHEVVNDVIGGVPLAVTW